MKLFLKLFLLFFCVSCSNRTNPKPPKDLISVDKMTNIIYDLYIINAAKGVEKKKFEEFGVLPKAYILRKYDVDSAQFAINNLYYSKKLEVYKGILDSVSSRLEREKNYFEELQKLKSKQDKEKKQMQKDSLNKIKGNLQKAFKKSDSVPKLQKLIK